jgi:hypothetical protein
MAGKDRFFAGLFQHHREQAAANRVVERAGV